MGASGSGKSTLLHLLGGLDKPSGGDVVIDGVDISALDDEQATLTRRDKTGFVFQFFNLIPLLTVRENVALPFLIGGGAAAEHRARVDELLDMVGLTRRPSTPRTSSPPASNSVSRWPAHLPPSRRFSWPMSRPETWTTRPAGDLGAPVPLLCPAGPDHRARDPRGARAAYADRVLVVRDGLILDEIHLGRREDHDPAPLLARLATLGL